MLLAPLHASELPVAVRDDALTGFSNAPDARIWHRSLRQTGDALLAKGLPAVNYEAHTPVRFNRRNYLALAGEFDFDSGVGLCYISLYLNRYGAPGPVPMRTIKATAETDRFNPESLEGKLFAGFNDTGLENGAGETLLKRFPERSRYETLPAAAAFTGTPPDSERSSAPAERRFTSNSSLRLWRAGTRCRPSSSTTAPATGNCPESARNIMPNTSLCRCTAATGPGICISSPQAWSGRNATASRCWSSSRAVSCRCGSGKADSSLSPANQTPSPFPAGRQATPSDSAPNGLGLYVPAWLPCVSALRSAAPAGRHFVERFLHGKARMLVNGWNSVAFEDYRQRHDPERKHDGYAFWTDLMGTDRRQPPPGVLWH